MKRSILVLVVLVSGLLASPAAMAQQPQEIPFDSTADFLKLPPGRNFG